MLDDEECPGEKACARGRGPLFAAIQLRVPAGKAGAIEAERLVKNLPADLIELECKRCPLLPTKSGKEPPHLQFALNEVARLESKKAIGVSLGVLSPFQEAILIGAHQGRSRSEVNRHKKNTQDSNSRNNKHSLPKGLGVMD